MDCAPWRIHVNAYAPGTVETNMTVPHFGDEGTRAYLQAMHPFRGLGKPDDLARVCVFLASEDAQWVSGVGICLDVFVDGDRLEAEMFRRSLYPSMVDIWQAEASSVAALCCERVVIVVYVRLASSRAGYLHLLYRNKKEKTVNPTIHPPTQSFQLHIPHVTCRNPIIIQPPKPPS